MLVLQASSLHPCEHTFRLRDTNLDHRSFRIGGLPTLSVKRRQTVGRCFGEGISSHSQSEAFCVLSGKAPRPLGCSSAADNIRIAVTKAGRKLYTCKAVQLLSEENGVSEPGDEETALVFEGRLERAGYHSVRMHGCTYMFATKGDGKLQLSDCYVYDEDSGIYATPEFEGEISNEHRPYQQVAWVEEFRGDILKKKNNKPWNKVLRVFLVPIKTIRPLELDLEEVYTLDSVVRTVRREVIERLTDSTHPGEVWLRIRDGKLTFERDQDMPGPEEVTLEYQDRQEQSKAARKLRPVEEAQEQDVTDEVEDDLRLEVTDVPAIDLE